RDSPPISRQAHGFEPLVLDSPSAWKPTYKSSKKPVMLAFFRLFWQIKLLDEQACGPLPMLLSHLGRHNVYRSAFHDRISRVIMYGLEVFRDHPKALYGWH